MKAKILKRVVYDGKTLNPGDIADITQWRNTRTLLSGRYLEILDEQAEEKKPSVAKSASVEPKVSEKEIKPSLAKSATDEPKVPAKIKDSKSE